MHSWPAPHIPAVDGFSPDLKVADPVTGELVPAASGPEASMYVCGVTPYDATHMGHAATFVTFDLVHRSWLDAGKTVRYAQNVTDVDTPLLARATERGLDWQALAADQIDLLRADMTALAVIPPHALVSVVEELPRIIDAVQVLLERDAAYRVPGEYGDDIYADLAADPKCAASVHLSMDEQLALFAERGGDPDRPGKRSKLDPLLWQAARPDEPSWDGGILGRGRPGWHIECSVLAADHVGLPFDVQGGGRDLAFPHHPMSASHGRMLGHNDFARRFVHSGFVGLNGERMSKSKGNLVFVSELLRVGVDPMAIRLAILAHHYASDWMWTDDVLATAGRRLERWRLALSRQTGPDMQPTIDAMRAAIANNLDAPTALAAIDGWVELQLARNFDEELAAPGKLSRTIDALLGIRL